MKKRVWNTLGQTMLLLFWLLLVQVLSAILLLLADLILELMLFGGIRPLTPNPLAECLIIGLLAFLFWFLMGRAAAPLFQLGPAGTAAALLVWGVLTCLLINADYVFQFSQQAVSGILLSVGEAMGLAFRELPAALASRFLLPAALGLGLLWGQRAHRRRAAPGAAPTEEYGAG